MNWSLRLPTQRQFWAVGLGHLTNDLFMASGVVLLTFLSGTVLPMSNTQIGFAVSAQQLAGAISQPFFGLRADKTGGKFIGGGGLAIVVLGSMLALFLAITTHNYYLMLIPFVLQGIGSGMTHPVGSLHSAEADEKRVGANMSYFFLMGQLGLALGPTIVGFLLDYANTGNYYLGLEDAPPPPVNVLPIFALGLLAIPSIIFMYLGIPSRRKRKEKNDKPKSGKSRMESWMPFMIIGLMVILRAFAQPGSVNFVPVLFEEKGWSPAEYGLITSSFWIASAFTGVLFGNLADRFDRRWIVMISMLLSVPAFFFLPAVDGTLAFVLAILAGGLSGGSHSLIVVLAQELVPDAKGFASGSILGFIFGAGAMGSLAIGAVSDVIGLATTFQVVAILAFISGFVALLLPKREVEEVL